MSFLCVYLLLASSWARYLVKPLSRTLSPSRWRNSSSAGPADSLLYISSSLLWPAMQYITPTFRWKLNYGEHWKEGGRRAYITVWKSCQSNHVDILGRTRVGILRITTLGCSAVIAVPFSREIMLTFSEVQLLMIASGSMSIKELVLCFFSFFKVEVCVCVGRYVREILHLNPT